jgi:predicted Zn-dependent peptidase
MQASRLANGVRIVSERLPDLPSITVGIWVENGSRYERDEQAGISHFLEHLFFKGTKRRTAAAIAEEIDAVGGVLNAFTGKEYTCYYAKVLREHLPLALDRPDDYVHELFNVAFWPGHPLARPIAGSAATVSGFKRDDFLRFFDARYRPDRILIAAAGDVAHDDLLGVASGHFGQLAGSAPGVDGAPPVPRPGVSIHEKALEQVHLCLGSPGIPQTDPDRYAAHVMNLALGGGMSSRLFQEIRERRGKAYTVYSFLASYLDAGYAGVYVGTSPEWVAEVVDVIRAELTRVTRDGLTDVELARARNQMKGNILLGLETSDSRMSRIAKNAVYFGRDVPLEEVAAAVDAVTNDDVLRVCRRLFQPHSLALTVLGDLKGHRLDEAAIAG